MACVNMSGRQGKEDALFRASHFATCPVVLKGLKCACANAFVYPSKVKDDLSLLANILAIQVLARLLVGIDWRVSNMVEPRDRGQGHTKNVGSATVAGGDGAAMFLREARRGSE